MRTNYFSDFFLDSLYNSTHIWYSILFLSFLEEEAFYLYLFNIFKKDYEMKAKQNYDKMSNQSMNTQNRSLFKLYKKMIVKLMNK